MNALPSTPALLMLAVLAPLISGLVLLIWGQRLSRQSAWVAGLGVLAAVVVAGLGWSVLAEQAFAPQSWLRGWIGIKEEQGSITVGIVRDALGLAMATLAALVAGSLILGAGEQGRQGKAERFFGALSFSFAGVLLAWFALTPWLSLMGVALSILGGFLAYGTRWDRPEEAALATRFGWERSWGLLLAVLGLCVLAGGRAALDLIPGGEAWSAGGGTDDLGAGLLVLGGLIQMQPFPLLGWVMRRSEIPAPDRIVLSQVLPAWAMLAILVRLDAQFREVGVFPVLGWVGLGSALLAAVAGALCASWRLALSAWTSCAFSLCLAVLAFAGPSSALSLAIGVGLAAAALASAGESLDGVPPVKKGESAERPGAGALKAAVGLAAAAGTGMVGFASAGACVRWLTFVLSDPALAAVSVLVFFLFAFLGWKTAWMAISLKGAPRAGWTSVVAPYLLIAAALGMAWTGTATGGAALGNPDRLFAPLLGFVFGPAAETWGDEAGFATASALHWGSLIVAIFAAFWTASRTPDFWPGVSRSMPRLSAFVASGYGIDPLFARAIALLSRLGAGSQWLVDHRLWRNWVPGALSTGLVRGSRAVAAADARLARWIGGMLRRWVDVPSKGLQILQNGDVQWYLFFAVGSGIAILAHFMRS